MKTLAINKDLNFGIIPESASKLRLAVLQDEEELVCRKEAKKKLIEFLEGPDGSTFKGRLILHKKDGAIQVEMKKELIGNLNLADILKII